MDENSKDMPKEKEIDINKLIKKEKNRLNKIYKNIPEKKYKTALKLIDNIAFMSVTLEKLMDEINNSELVVKTKNASQEFSKESPRVTAYNKMYSNFLKGIQHLNSLLPSDENKKSSNDFDDPPDDAFLKFMKAKK